MQRNSASSALCHADLLLSDTILPKGRRESPWRRFCRGGSKVAEQLGRILTGSDISGALLWKILMRHALQGD
jgi:hypothetical protein